ncbi:MAG TPA: pyruvate kinase [Chloroflexota bacterium]|nr:pyruvate kinase [Chloroflexota bacterium]
MPRTRIVATLGPATDRPGVLEAVLAAGVDVARLNASHGTQADHLSRLHAVRRISESLRRPVAILLDLQGPKIRVGKLPQGGVELKAGSEFVSPTGVMLPSRQVCRWIMNPYRVR